MTGQMEQMRDKQLFHGHFLIGAFLIIGIYFLGLYLIRSENYRLYFSVLCILMALRVGLKLELPVIESLNLNGLAMAREGGAEFRVGYSLSVLGSVALARDAYAEALDSLREAARFEGMRRKTDLSVNVTLLGCAARGQGDLDQARLHLAEALRLGVESASVRPLLWALPMIGLFLVDQGEVERAVEIDALASRYEFVANSRWFEDVVGRHIAAAAAQLPPQVVERAKERGRARDLDATVAELLTRLEG